MTTYRTEIDSPRDRDEVFEYLATFSNAGEWDPGVTEAEPLTPGPPDVGSVYRLRVRVAGRTVPFDYRVVAIDRPTRVVLRAEQSGDGVDGHDHGGASRVGARRSATSPCWRAAACCAWPHPSSPGRSDKMADRGADGLRRALA